MIERILMFSDGECIGVNIEPGQWHRIVSRVPGTVIFEAKDGSYEQLRYEDILNV